MTPLLALAGLPLALAAGLLADAAGEAAGRWWKAGPSGARPADLSRAWRRASAGGRRPVTGLQAVGTLLALGGGGLAAAAAIGAIPGSMGLVLPSLVGASAGARLAASDAATRVRAARAAEAEPHLLAFEVLMLAAALAALARWHAGSLEAVRGVQAVLGPGVAVGPASRAAALLLAVLAMAVAAGARVPQAGAGAPGRGLRAEPAVLVALARWSALGAAAVVAAALAAGPALGSGGGWASPARALPAWGLSVLVSSAVVGAACRGLGDRPAGLRARAVILGGLTLAIAAAFALGAA